MESEPVKRTIIQEHSEVSLEASEGTVQPALQEVISRLWEAVRHGADVIVTLRQENAILQAQVSSLSHSETDLQARIDDLLAHIDAMDHSALADSSQIDRIEDGELAARIQELEASMEEVMAARTEAENKLVVAQQALADTAVQLEEHRDVSQQVLQLRSELETRAHLLQELQEGFTDREPGEHSAVYTIQLEEERDRLSAELDRALEIVEDYRSAGLRHLENPSGKDQLDLFLGDASNTKTSAPSQSLEEVADRLEEMARQLDELAGLS